MPVSVSVVVTGEEEVMFTDGWLNVNVGMYPDVLVAMAEKFTVPVKLLAGVAVMVAAGIVPPAETVTPRVLPEDVPPAAVAVSAKSGQVVFVTWTTTGVVVLEPLAVRVGPIDPW
jgi:hypothetical protein